MPPLRFPEFTDEWEKQILKEYLEENKTRNTKGWFSKKDVLSVSGDFGIVNQIEYLGRSFAGVSVANYHVVRKGDIVYTKSPLKEYPYGIVKSNKGVDGIVSTLYAVYEPKSNTISDFVEYYFALASRTNKYFKPIVRIGAKHDMKIGNDEVLENFVSFPCLDEQRKISQFLSLIEKRIALQTKIIEKYKSLIKGIRDVLLVDNCSRPIPLSEILIEFTEKTTMNNQYEVLSSTVSGIYSQKEIFNKEVASPNNIGYKILHYDDVVLSPQNLWMGNINYNDKYKIGIVSPSYKTYRIAEDYDKKFIAAILKTHRALYNYMLVSEQGASVVRRNLNIEAFEQLIFKIPNYEKQQKIGSILRNLEYKLSRLERLKNCYLRQKQFFLQQMFI